MPQERKLCPDPETGVVLPHGECGRQQRRTRGTQQERFQVLEMSTSRDDPDDRHGHESTQIEDLLDWVGKPDAVTAVPKQVWSPDLQNADRVKRELRQVPDERGIGPN